MCIYPFKNWELNDNLENLNDFTAEFIAIEIDDKEPIIIDSEKEKEKS